MLPKGKNATGAESIDSVDRSWNKPTKTKIHAHVNVNKSNANEPSQNSVNAYLAALGTNYSVEVVQIIASRCPSLSKDRR